MTNRFTMERKKEAKIKLIYWLDGKGLSIEGYER
jgi:hypothetical protein